MRNGLKILQLPGTFGYAVTLVGWLRRKHGDDWVLLPGARPIRRTGTARGLGWLAARGPGSDYRLFAPSETIEDVHRLSGIRRVFEANEEVWLEHCPKPKDWVDE